MAEKTFDDLTAANALTGSEVLPIWQGGAAKKATPAQLRSWLPDSIADIAALDPQAATKIYELWAQVAATVPGQVGTVRSVVIGDADHTLTYEDLHSPTVVIMNSSSARRVFYPTQTSVPHTLMTQVEIIQYGVGAVTVVGAPGVVVNAGTKEPTTSGRGASAVVRSPFTNEVLVTGDLLLSGGPQLVTPPSVNVSPVQGSTLTLTPAVCSPDGTHTRQWIREHATTGAQTNIGAGALTYDTVVGDIGFYVWCLETITDAQGRSISVPTNKQLIVATGVSKPQKSTEPSFLPGSSHAVGGEIIVDAGDYSNAPTGYKFQRKIDGVNSGGVTNQAGRTLSYTSTGPGVVSYTVVAYNAAGDSDDVGTSPGWLVAAGTPQWTANPVITVQGGGAAEAGCTLDCSNGATNPPATSYQRRWRFLDNISAGGPFGGYIEPAATGASYGTSTDDVNSVILCEVTPVNADGPGPTVTAVGPLIVAATPPPPPPPPPPPSSEPGNRIAPGSLVPSGPITASSGQVISGRLFSSADAIHITIPAGVVGVLIEDCTLVNATNSCIQNQGTDTTVRFCDVGESARGILTHTGTGVVVEYNEFDDFSTGTQFEGHAQEIILSAGPSTVRFNRFIGTNYKSDVASNFQSSNITFTDNEFDVQIDEPSGAAFTIGDALDQASPGSNNYVARNIVLQSGGVPAGVFGSNGNTVLEKNCFTAGIQAYNYNGNNFVGVVIRQNVINMSASFVPMTAAQYGGEAAWGSNIDSTNCALVPA